MLPITQLSPHPELLHIFFGSHRSSPRPITADVPQGSATALRPVYRRPFTTSYLGTSNIRRRHSIVVSLSLITKARQLQIYNAHSTIFPIVDGDGRFWQTAKSWSMLYCSLFAAAYTHSSRTQFHSCTIPSTVKYLGVYPDDSYIC
jgi:hypothetical protein